MKFTNLLFLVPHQSQQEIVSGINAWSLSVSTVLLATLGRGGIDHAAYADLSPISQQTKRILLVFLKTFLEIGPGGLEVFPRHVSESLPLLPCWETISHSRIPFNDALNEF